MSLSVEMDGEDAKDDGAEIKFEAIPTLVKLKVKKRS